MRLPIGNAMACPQMRCSQPPQMCLGVLIEAASARHPEHFTDRIEPLRRQKAVAPALVVRTDEDLFPPSGPPRGESPGSAGCTAPNRARQRNQDISQIFAGYCHQYFGQNSGSRLGHGAIVTTLFVIGAGCCQAMPLGSMLRHALEQMVREGTPLEARQGQHRHGIPGVLTGFACGERARAQTGIAVKVTLGL
jgi:hypothetical protein